MDPTVLVQVLVVHVHVDDCLQKDGRLPYYTWAEESEKLEDLLVAGYIAGHGQVSRLRQALNSSEFENQSIHPRD